MRAVIIGGGKVGSYLAKRLAREGNAVFVIEPSAEIAPNVVGQSHVIVLHGDGTDVDLLKDANVGKADWVLAVTGRDEVNLVAAQLAGALGAKKVLARLNDPANAATFEALGIRSVAVTDLMVGVLERDLLVDALESTVLLAGGRLSILEFEVGQGFAPTPIQDIDIPASSLIIVVEREGEFIVPRGPVVINPGDRLVTSSLSGDSGDLPVLFCVDGAET